MSPRLTAAVLAVGVSACATAAKPRAVDLQPARQALEAARAEGAAERAPETFTRAEGELKEAERLVAEKGADAPLAAVEAEWAARLALAEARCAAKDTPAPAAPAEEVRRLEVRARRSEEEQRRLEEQIALRQRELEVTETELIRTKARLKGLETRAEASSAIAEAKILVQRLESRGRSSPVRAAAEESLKKAEDQLTVENYGAALFFALKAQDMVTKAGEPKAVADTDAERPAPQPVYVVSVDSANIRQSPTLQSAVLAEVKRGTRLQALAVRGAWAKVSHESVTGWVSLKVVD